MRPGDPFLPLSALQHLLFCERQCALIHLEQLWEENRFTAEGRVLHEKAHDGPDESRPGVRITRGLALASARLGLSGQADVVEFHRDGTILPVEYKRGKPKPDDSDRVQLCAQALCLEEMFGRPVPAGCLFYGQRKRRTDVAFEPALRAATEDAVRRLRALIAAGITPPAVHLPKCASCSLERLCLPAALRFRRGAEAWFLGRLTASLAASPENGSEAN